MEDERKGIEERKSEILFLNLSNEPKVLYKYVTNSFNRVKFTLFFYALEKFCCSENKLIE